jgi:zinc resistance-associated protein
MEAFMFKPLLAGAMVIAIAASSLAYAQQRPAASGAEPQTTGARERAERPRISAEDAQAFADARIAGLKAGLKLTPEQEKNWPAVETAIRDLTKARFERMQARRDGGDRQLDPIERLRQRADVMTERAAGLKKLADASEPLYKRLDDAQKRRLTILTRQALRGGHWHGERGPRGPQQRL